MTAGISSSNSWAFAVQFMQAGRQRRVVMRFKAIHVLTNALTRYEFQGESLQRLFLISFKMDFFKLDPLANDEPIKRNCFLPLILARLLSLVKLINSRTITTMREKNGFSAYCDFTSQGEYLLEMNELCTEVIQRRRGEYLSGIKGAAVDKCHKSEI